MMKLDFDLHFDGLVRNGELIPERCVTYMYAKDGPDTVR
jgi:hypothetical protein